MKKEIIICILVITLVIIGNIVTQKHTEQCISNIDYELENLKEKITEYAKNDQQNKQEQENELKTKSHEIRDSWDDMQETLSFYVEHDELEKVETQLSLLEGEMETKLYDDAIPEIEKCQFILEHISDKTALNIKNIF